MMTQKVIPECLFVLVAVQTRGGGGGWKIANWDGLTPPLFLHKVILVISLISHHSLLNITAVWFGTSNINVLN